MTLKRFIDIILTNKNEDLKHKENEYLNFSQVDFKLLTFKFV